ncbi:MAG: hypothetical protein ACHQ1G_04035 [Planctomycetota bacterium]
MGRWILFAAVVAILGCEGDDAIEAPRGSYLRPAVQILLSQVADPSAQAATTTLVYGTVTERLAETPATALWAAVGKAGTEGLEELYGVEFFGLEEPTYEAMVFVRTSRGTSCLYANADLHGVRDLPRTVPSQPIASEEFALLRDRILVHLPFPRPASVEGVGPGAEVALLHVLRDGRCMSALWRVPAAEWGADRVSLRAYRRDYQVAAIVSALWAAMPMAFFDGDGVKAEDAYANLPGY